MNNLEVWKYTSKYWFQSTTEYGFTACSGFFFSIWFLYKQHNTKNYSWTISILNQRFHASLLAALEKKIEKERGMDKNRIANNRNWTVYLVKNIFYFVCIYLSRLKASFLFPFNITNKIQRKKSFLVFLPLLVLLCIVVAGEIFSVL